MQRKHYSPEFKQQIVKEALEVGNSSIVARKYDINNNMVSILKLNREKFSN